jgi:hypothetical protein
MVPSSSYPPPAIYISDFSALFRPTPSLQAPYPVLVDSVESYEDDLDDGDGFITVELKSSCSGRGLYIVKDYSVSDTGVYDGVKEKGWVHVYRCPLKFRCGVHQVVFCSCSFAKAAWSTLLKLNCSTVVYSEVQRILSGHDFTCLHADVVKRMHDIGDLPEVYLSTVPTRISDVSFETVHRFTIVESPSEQKNRLLVSLCDDGKMDHSFVGNRGGYFLCNRRTSADKHRCKHVSLLDDEDLDAFSEFGMRPPNLAGGNENDPPAPVEGRCVSTTLIPIGFINNAMKNRSPGKFYVSPTPNYM